MPETPAAMTPSNQPTAAVARTDVGWIAIFGEAPIVSRLSIGFSSEDDAKDWLKSYGVSSLSTDKWATTLDTLCAYLRGELFGLDQIEFTEQPRSTQFQRQVRQVVAAIPYGECRTYGEVAELAGRPRAARAVGTVMAANHVPLLLPCHRVVPAGGKLGGYTGPGGVKLKQRLLELERQVERSST